MAPSATQTSEGAPTEPRHLHDPLFLAWAAFTAVAVVWLFLTMLEPFDHSSDVFAGFESVSSVESSLHASSLTMRVYIVCGLVAVVVSRLRRGLRIEDSLFAFVSIGFMFIGGFLLSATHILLSTQSATGESFALSELYGEPHHDLTAAFDAYYCRARGVAVCSSDQNADALVAMFGGTQRVQVNWFTSVESDSVALRNALHSCRQLLVANAGELSPTQKTFMRARSRVSSGGSGSATSISGTTSTASRTSCTNDSSVRSRIDAWCGAYLAKNGSPDAGAGAASDAVSPSKGFHDVFETASAIWYRRRSLDRWMVALSLLAAVVAYNV